VNAELPEWSRTAWRWRILYLRTFLDLKRLVDEKLESDDTQAALRELIGIYRAKLNDDGTDPYHHRVRPPLTAGSTPIETRK
jgi:hypothetical protein